MPKGHTLHLGVLDLRESFDGVDNDSKSITDVDTPGYGTPRTTGQHCICVRVGEMR